MPHSDKASDLLVLLLDICDLDVKPHEVIIVNATSIAGMPPCLSCFVDIFKDLEIHFIFADSLNSFPSSARNHGITIATGDVLAFLDVSTRPPIDWLTLAVKQLHPDVDCVWGRTSYLVEGYFNKLLRCATYGNKPLVTLPGSLIRRSAFYRVGLFVEWTRAGEDADWMSRFNLHKLSAATGNSVLTYSKLNQLGFLNLLKKWYRNYFYGAQMPYLRAHKTTYYHAAVLFCLMFAFNWNAMWASWDETNNLYFPHVTKITLVGFLLAYIILRGILLPVRKGVACREILPVGWVVVALISLVLDVTKLLAFARSRFKLIKVSRTNG